MTSATASGARRAWSRPVVAATLLIALAASLGGLRALRARSDARAAHPTTAGVLAVAGLGAPVEVLRDVHGVPHVWAESERDAFVALGFVHAQDRLAQMLWLRRLARGRSAEVIGAGGLPADRLARTLGLGRLADAEFERSDRSTRETLRAYALGVTARIERVRSGAVGRPLALRDWSAPLEDWQPADALALLKLYAWGVSGTLDVALVLDDLIEQLGGIGARRFFPRGDGAGAAPGPEAPPVRARAAAPARGFRDPLRRMARLEGRTIGSSAWVVGGGLSRSGLPILAADSHLEPTAPALLHLDHFRGGDLEVAGAMLPGVPVVWSGANARVVWAATQAGAVASDVFHETLHASDPGLYHDGRGWRALSLREERIAVRGAPDELLRVRATQHGPLVHELVEPGRDGLSVAWSGARIGEGSSVGALLRVARARDAASLRRALAGLREPPLLVAYADAEGEAGLQLAGWIPRRELASGLVPLPGRARWYDWSERIAFDALPARRLASPRDWLIAADDTLASPAAAERIEWLWRSGARARNIDAVLSEATRVGRLDLRRAAALQTDVQTRRGRELVSLVLALGDRDGRLGEEAGEIAGLLRAWDGRETADSVGCAAYHVLRERLTRVLLGRHLDDALLERYLALPHTDPAQLVLEILRAAAAGEAAAGWSEPEAVARAVRESLREAWLSLSYRMGANRARWTWGRLHSLVFRPLARVPDGAPALPSLGPFGAGGSGDTLNTAAYDPAHPFDVRVASLVRIAADTGSLDQLLTSLAPGESEHPRHPQAQAGLADWLAGRAHLLATHRVVFEELAGGRLLLEPGP